MGGELTGSQGRLAMRRRERGAGSRVDGEDLHREQGRCRRHVGFAKGFRFVIFHLSLSLSLSLSLQSVRKESLSPWLEQLTSLTT
jgi:hypothetical protein